MTFIYDTMLMPRIGNKNTECDYKVSKNYGTLLKNKIKQRIQNVKEFCV